MKFSVIIPARFASQRLPGKPLLDIAGKPMIQRVVECAQRSAASRIIVATDDQRIADAVAQFGGEVCMTASSHQSGTDRLQEVVSRLSMNADDIVVNVQGDEPLIPAAVINQVATNLEQHPQASCATLSEALISKEDCFNPNVVKVVADNAGMALYFSRASIPWDRDAFASTAEENTSSISGASRHIGIYAYRVSLLQEFVSWPVAELEKIEKLEQLRILANGHRIHVQRACEEVPGGVDTVEDLQRLNLLLRKN